MAEGAQESGIWLTVAALCEKVLREDSGIPSAIRLVDQFTLTAEEPDAPERMPPVRTNLSFLVGFKSSGVDRTVYSTIRVLAPNGRVIREPPPVPATLSAQVPADGFFVQWDLTFPFEEAGPHWIEVLLDGLLVTRHPFQIVYRRSQSEQVPEPESLP